MSDQSLNLNSSNWSDGLNKAQASAARFIAFIANLEGTFQKVASGSMDVAGAIAAIGGVSSEVKAEMEALAAGESTLAQMMASIGGSAEQMTATVTAMLAGNISLEKSLENLGVKFARDTKTLEADTAAVTGNMEARDKLMDIMAKMKASQLRDIQSGADVGKPRLKSPDAFVSTNPMDYESAADIRIARMMHRMQRMATAANVPLTLPSMESGEGKGQLNMARLQMTMENLRESIKGVKAAEDEREAAEQSHYVKMKARLNEAIALNEKLHAAKRKQQLLDQAEHRKATFASLDQMYGTISRGRTKELAAQGIITLGKETKKTETFITSMFKKFERGTALGTKGVLGVVRGLQNANSQMALLTSSFAGLLAMVGGISAGAFFKMSMDFEKAMTRVNLLVKKGESDLATLTDQAKELSRQFGSSPMATAEGMRIAISSDVPPGEVMKFMKEAEKLAVMSNSSTEKTADLLAMLRNAFNLSVNDLSRLRDMIFVMTDRGRVEVDQFAAEIGKIAPTAKLAGVGIQEMMAAFAGLSRTRSTEQAGTLLRNLFKNIIDPSKEAKKAIHEFGLGLTPAAVRANGLIKTITKFRAELQKHPGLLNTVADDLRELSAWGDLTDSQFEALTTTFDEMSASVGLADQKTKEMMDTTSVRWDRLMSQLKISAIDMGASLLGVFDNWTKGSNGVELMQKKIEQGFKRLELGVRYFLAAVEFVGTMAAVAFGGVATALVTIWGLLKNIYNFAKRGMEKMEVIGDTGKLEEIQAKILKLKEEGFGEGSKEVQALAKEEQKQAAILDKSLGNLDETEGDIKTTIEDMVERIKASWKPAKVMGDAFVENGKKAGELAHEIADLDLVIQNMEYDSKAAGDAQQQLATKTQKVTEVVRDQTQLIKEWTNETLKSQVVEGHEKLKEWIKDNRDAIKGAISANREWGKEQTRVAQDAIKDLEKLREQRDKFNDSIKTTVEKLKDQDRTPKQQLKSRLEEGQKFESLANKALKAGDKDRAEDLVKDAMAAYESMLEVLGGNTKKNRALVLKNIERLQEQMNSVFKTEEGDLQSKLDEAAKKGREFEETAKAAEERLKVFEQGVTDVGRAIKELSTAPTEEALMKIKDMITKLTGDAGWFEKFTADPALQAMEKVIEKAKELKDIMGTVPDELIMKLEGSALMDLLRGTTGFVPMEPAATMTNNTNTKTINVDSIHVVVGSDNGGPSKVDARRLARDIKRYIERGEAPALGGK